MTITKLIRNITIVSVFAFSVALLGGCGGVSEAQLMELNNLRAEVQSLEAEANSLRDERAALEKEIQEKNLKLAQCEKQKEETRANLNKIGDQ
ncbi:MAG: hypothetical protein Kow0098_10400 [Ignavibacteriaceae bacterium]